MFITFISSVLTTENGVAVFSSVHFGTNYKVKAEYPDYYDAEKTGISVTSEVNTAVSLDSLKYKYSSVCIRTAVERLRLNIGSGEAMEAVGVNG